MTVIQVQDLHMKFKVFYDKGQSLKEKILFKNRNYYEYRWVLKNINLEVEKGEAIGLIGENGSGKSTLLKMMSKILYPNQGRITMNGRISSLIELGAGFHPDMSGRENIYTNASIFGLTRKEIEKRLSKIIEFSELEEFIDNPVRTYSSGMYMRLAFSVAINVDADILLIDEILAVGDSNFQAKCFDKLRELKSSGLTIIIVSHDLGTIEKFCNRSVWLKDGKIAIFDASPYVIDTYLNYMSEKKIEAVHKKEENVLLDQVENNDATKSLDNQTDTKENENDSLATETKPEIDYNANRFGLRYIEIEHACLRNSSGKKTNILKAGEETVIEIYYKVNKPLDEYVFGVGFYTIEGICLMGSNTQLDRIKILHDKINGLIRFKIPKLTLLSGKYILNVAVVDVNGTPMDFYRNYSTFDVVSNDRSVGFMSIEHEWLV